MIDEDDAGPDAEASEEPDFNYRPLLEALRDCRALTSDMCAAISPRAQIHIEAEKLQEQIDAVARLTRVPAAVRFVRRRKEEKM